MLKMFKWTVDHIHEEKNFITQEEIEKIIAYGQSIASKDKYSEIIDNFGRIVFPFGGVKDPEIRDLMIDLEKRAYAFIIGQYAPSKNLRVTGLSWKRDVEIVRWTYGGLQGHRDGHPELPTREPLERGMPISSLIYLTDNFEGGELFFEDFNFKVKPSAGSFFIFPSFYMHEVTNIDVKEDSVGRYTLPFFHGFNVKEFGPAFLEEPNSDGYEYGDDSFEEIVLRK